jgi:MYXO-CTERM domain-containing protein
MKHTLTMGFCALALCAAAGPARAALFFSDQFSYANGDLTTRDDGVDPAPPAPGENVSGGLWKMHSGEGTGGEIDVIGGQAQLLFPGFEDANREIPSAGSEFMTAGETWYYAAKVTVNDQRATPDVTAILASYFMHFKDPGTSNFRSRLFVDAPSTGLGGAGYRLAIGPSSGDGNRVPWTADLAFGQQYTIVASYVYDTGAVSLWVNPSDPSSASVTATGGAGPLAQITSLALRQVSSAGATANTQILVDAVAMGDTFASALTGLVPEPSGGVLGLAGLLGLAATRRRSGC